MYPLTHPTYSYPFGFLYRRKIQPSITTSAHITLTLLKPGPKPHTTYHVVSIQYILHIYIYDDISFYVTLPAHFNETYSCGHSCLFTINPMFIHKLSTYLLRSSLYSAKHASLQKLLSQFISLNLKGGGGIILTNQESLIPSHLAY